MNSLCKQTVPSYTLRDARMTPILVAGFELVCAEIDNLQSELLQSNHHGTTCQVTRTAKDSTLQTVKYCDVNSLASQAMMPLSDYFYENCKINLLLWQDVNQQLCTVMHTDL